MVQLVKFLTSAFLIALAGSVFASTVDEVLSYKENPVGVVFEIISGDVDALRELVPQLRKDIDRLHKKYPDLPIAIVSHGMEEFLLTSDNRKNAPEVHEFIEQLTSNEKIEVHVCGTHASWYGISEEDFPDYVDVTHTGPAQINDYEELGYDLIVLP